MLALNFLMTVLGTARRCRRCAQPIGSNDFFGQSEGVCSGCRS
jgi:hypothetical protein